MDNNNNNNNGQHHHGGQCNCDCHGGEWGGWSKRQMRFGLLRWVLGLIIIWMVFSLGQKIGVIEDQVANGMWFAHDYRMMNYNTPVIRRSTTSQGASAIEATAPAATSVSAPAK